MDNTNDNQTFRIFLSAGEASSDTHCAHLIEALKARHGNVEFAGPGRSQDGDRGLSPVGQYGRTGRDVAQCH